MELLHIRVAAKVLETDANNTEGRRGNKIRRSRKSLENPQIGVRDERRGTSLESEVV